MRSIIEGVEQAVVDFNEYVKINPSMKPEIIYDTENQRVWCNAYATDVTKVNKSYIPISDYIIGNKITSDRLYIAISAYKSKKYIDKHDNT